MDAKEVEAILGTPHEVYRDEFGQSTASPWEGEVWLYFVGLDDSSEYVKRYNKTMLVFATEPTGTSLVFWQAK